MTASKYEELVKALTDAGVALRDVNGDYRSTYDIMKDIASVWDDMSDMEQAALTTAVAGTRMQNVFASLVGSFKEASGAMESMDKSSGMLSKSYNTYIDSIEGRTAQLKATFQALSQSIIQSSTVKGLITSLTGLVNVLDLLVSIGNGIPAKIILISLLLKAVPLASITNLLKAFTLNTTLASIAELRFSEVLAATNTQSLLGFILLIPKAIAGLVALGAEFSFAELKALGLKGALELLNINPVMLALSALVVVLGAAAAVAYQYTEAGLSKTLSKDADTLSNTVSEMENINNELDTTKSRIRELLAKDKLTFVEQNELERLQRTNSMLERQLVLKQAIKKAESTKVRNDFERTMDQWADAKMPMMGTSATTTGRDILNSLFRGYQQAFDDMQNATDDSAYKEAEERRDRYITQLTDTIEKLRGYKAALDDVDYSSLTPAQKEYYDMIEQYETKFAMLDDKVSGDGVALVLGQQRFAELNDELQRAANSGEDLADVYGGLTGKLNTDKWRDFIQELSSLTGIDYGEAYQLLLKYITGLKDAEDVTNDLGETSETTLEKLKSELSDISSEIDDLQSAYDTVSGLLSDYEEKGYLSLDNLQALLQLEPEYLNLLMDENGQLNLNAESYEALAKAKLEDLLLTQIKTTFANILEMGVEEAAAYAAAEAYDSETSSLYKLIEAETQHALLQASVKDRDNNTTAYTDAVSRYITTIPTLVSLVDDYSFAAEHATSESDALKDSLNEQKDALEAEKDALEDSKQALEDYKDELEDAQNQIQDLIDLVMDYLKKQKEAEKDVLNERKDAFDDLIEKEKEELALKKEAAEFEETLKSKQNAVAKDALAASIASLDDSSAGKKAKKAADDALIESRADLYSTLADHEYDLRVAALDAIKEKQDEYYDSEIQKIDDYLDNERRIYEDACREIENDTGDLYGRLWDYTYRYTTQTRAEFDHLWTSAQDALAKYGGAQVGVINIMEYLQLEIYDTERQIGYLDDAIGVLDSRIDSVSTAINNLGNGSINNLTNRIRDLKRELSDLEELNSDKWVYEDYNGRNYYSKLEDRGDAIRDIMGQMGVDPINYTRAGSAIVASGHFHRYASGTYGAYGGPSIVNEQGHEIRILNKGDGILTAKMTKNLSNFAANPAGALMDAGRNLLSKITNSTLYQSMFGSRYPSIYGVNSRTDQPINFTNYINGDVNPSTLKALVSAQEKITENAINGMMKRTLGLRNSSRAR